MATDIKPDDLFYRRIQWGLIFSLVVAELFAIGLSFLKLAKGKELFSWYLFGHQDALIITPILLGIFLLRPQSVSSSPPVWWERWFQHRKHIILIASLLTIICWAGYYLVFLGRDFTRDEQMANFDAYIFSHGRLFWPIPPYWRQFIFGLNQTFILPIGDHEAWVSAYLPVNAAIRAAVGTIADPAVTGPLYVGIGAIALWSIATRLWPDSKSAKATALILYAGSAQVLIMGMTAFAMPAHLAFNLVWLALFLRNSRLSHVGALGIGFLATGLHQPLFHPLFVLPFMWQIMAQRRWRLVIVYGTGYALICAFWLAWPIWISSHGVAPNPGDSADKVDFLSRLAAALPSLSLKGIWLTILNLLRFVAWQHLLLLPLIVLGLRVAWRGDKIARALAVGFFLPIPVMLILLPYQGHGWGYRYLHGVIGNACLLGGYGIKELEGHGLSFRRAMTWANIATFLIIIPAEAVMARRMITPYAKVDQMIARSGASIAIVDDFSAPFAQDVVINKPDLSNRPIRLMARGLKPEDLKEFCSHKRSIFIRRDDLFIIDRFFGKELSKLTLQQIELNRSASSCQMLRSENFKLFPET